MTPKPSVGVVIPCYNDGATVTGAIASVVDQADQIVVVDDGSTCADTQRLMPTLERGNVTVIRQDNAGLSAARMTGVHALTTDLVIGLDADDVFDPGSLVDLAAEFTRRPELSVVFGDTEMFGRYTGRVSIPFAYDPWLATYVNLMPGAGSMIRRDHLIAAGGWQLRGGYEDWDLWLALHAARRLGAYIPRTVLHYRQGHGRMLADSQNHHAELFGQIRARHAKLFEARELLRENSRAPARCKLLFDRIERHTTLDQAAKHRLHMLTARPTAAVRVRYQDLRARIRHDAS